MPYLGDEAINVAQQSSNSAQKHNTACHPHNPFIKMPHWGRPFSDDAIVELVDRLTDLSNFENFYAELVGEQSIDIKSKTIIWQVGALSYNYWVIILNSLADIPLEIITKEDAFKLISEQFPKEKMTPAIIREMFVMKNVVCSCHFFLYFSDTMPIWQRFKRLMRTCQILTVNGITNIQRSRQCTHLRLYFVLDAFFTNVTHIVS